MAMRSVLGCQGGDGEGDDAEDELWRRPSKQPAQEGPRCLMLQVLLARPGMHGYSGPGWELPNCGMIMHVGGEMQGVWDLPTSPFKIAGWRHRVDVPVGWDWIYACLELEVLRENYCAERGVVFRLEQPSSSEHIAVIGRARLPLLDALVLGDDNDDDDGRARKNSDALVVSGTRVFHKVVPLEELRHSEEGSGEAMREVRGVVTVTMRFVEWP